MKRFAIFILTVLSLGCSSRTDNRVSEASEYFYHHNSLFGVWAELELASDSTFKDTSVDFHAGFGGVRKGTYSWHDRLLILKNENANRSYLFLDSARLYFIEERDSIIAENTRYNQGFEVTELLLEPGLAPYMRPAHSNLEYWTQGRIENFEELVEEFKRDPEHFFEKN